MIKTTFHAKIRYKERTNYSEEEIKKLADIAFKHGYRLRRFRGHFFHYLICRQKRGYGHSVRVYDNHVFIFDNVSRLLLTVYPVPDWYLPVSRWFIDSEDESGGRCFIKVTDSYGEVSYIGMDQRLTDDIGLAMEFKSRSRANVFVKNNVYLKNYQIDII